MKILHLNLRFYGGDEDLPSSHRLALESISTPSGPGTIRVIDIHKHFPDPSNAMSMPGEWALRPFAILASSFRNVILTDADTIFLQDPALLLSEPGFIDKGALFYRDRVLGPAKTEVYDWLDNLLDEVNAKNMKEIKKGSGWFSRSTFYEMERYPLFHRLPDFTVELLQLIKREISLLF